jgi:hypothetical protein
MKELTVDELNARMASMEATIAAAVSELRRATTVADSVAQMMIARLGRHFTVDETAIAWGVSVRTIQRKIRAGELTLELIPGTHVNGIPADQVFGRWIDVRVARATRRREHEQTHKS